HEGIADLGAEDVEGEENLDDFETDLADSGAQGISEAQQSRKIKEISEIGEIDDYKPLDYRSLQEKMDAEAEVKHNWAHVVDLNHKIENFDDIVPNMARKWPFELDTFQKEAVYHLEQGDSVFVAAHTSAGKTVVAE
ncbi:hypothetical protein OXX79_013836, partial [Metschnikowia pulcherrima]